MAADSADANGYPSSVTLGHVFTLQQLRARSGATDRTAARHSLQNMHYVKPNGSRLAHARLWVRRLKNSLSVEQPIAGDELRAIKRYLATRTDKLSWRFLSERRQPLTRQAVNYLVAQAAR